MPRFRKKPVEVEAFQMTEERAADQSEWPDWLSERWTYPYGSEGSMNWNPDSGKMVIHTLERAHRVNWDDWIIQGVAGELYSVKPEIFEATYELVD